VTYGTNTGRWTLMYSAAAPSAMTMSQTSAQFHDHFFISDASVAEGRD
jgi:hypothetical protein